MHKVLLIFIITYFFSLPALTLTKKDFTDKQLLCPKLLWGVEFISSNMGFNFQNIAFKHIYAWLADNLIKFFKRVSYAKC